MKYAITPHTNVSSIPNDADELHFVRPLKLQNLQRLLRKCRNLQCISVSASCASRLPDKAKKILEQRNIAIKFTSNRGRAIGIEIQKIKQIVDLQQNEKSFREIESALGIPKSTAHYLIRYAERTKVRDGNKIVYLD